MVLERLACSVAAVVVAASLPQDLPKKPETPYEKERSRLQQEIQGMWEVVGYRGTDPELQTLVRASGYMSVQEGWLTMQAVLTVRDPVLNLNAYHFTASTKQWSLTPANRLHVSDVWGFEIVSKGPSHVMKPYVAGSEEDRVIVLTGPPMLGQKLRVQRGTNDYFEFLRRTLPPKQPAAPSAQDR